MRIRDVGHCVNAICGHHAACLCQHIQQAFIGMRLGAAGNTRTCTCSCSFLRAARTSAASRACWAAAAASARVVKAESLRCRCSCRGIPSQSGKASRARHANAPNLYQLPLLPRALFDFCTAFIWVPYDMTA